MFHHRWEIGGQILKPVPLEHCGHSGQVTLFGSLAERLVPEAFNVCLESLQRLAQTQEASYYIHVVLDPHCPPCQPPTSESRQDGRLESGKFRASLGCGHVGGCDVPRDISRGVRRARYVAEWGSAKGVSGSQGPRAVLHLAYQPRKFCFKAFKPVFLHELRQCFSMCVSVGRWE